MNTKILCICKLSIKLYTIAYVLTGDASHVSTELVARIVKLITMFGCEVTACNRDAKVLLLRKISDTEFFALWSRINIQHFLL
jgi:hypothetical protein